MLLDERRTTLEQAKSFMRDVPNSAARVNRLPVAGAGVHVGVVDAHACRLFAPVLARGSQKSLRSPRARLWLQDQARSCCAHPASKQRRQVQPGVSRQRSLCVRTKSAANLKESFREDLAPRRHQTRPDERPPRAPRQELSPEWLQPSASQRTPPRGQRIPSLSRHCAEAAPQIPSAEREAALRQPKDSPPSLPQRGDGSTPPLRSRPERDRRSAGETDGPARHAALQDCDASVRRRCAW
eukprot:scaffold735_cov255-Pinguiococcus_pyrenoidosus.AAC.22